MYLITNTSMRDSLYVEGVRIGSQKTKKFETLTPLSLALLKRTQNAKIQLIKNVSKENIDSTTVSTTNKQKPAKRTVESLQPAEHKNTEDNVVEDKEN